MDEVFLNKTFSLIATGLIHKEKILEENPTRYPHSRILQHGINMFLAASQQAGSTSFWKYADEASFLNHYISMPIADWFKDWDSAIVEKLGIKEATYYHYSCFAYSRGNNVYTPSSDCFEYLSTQDNDLMDGTDERFLYNLLRELDQDMYCFLRKYIIEHPIITLEERRRMSLLLAGNQGAKEAFQFAYEEYAEECYRCPCCGWTMTRRFNKSVCHSNHCSDVDYDLTDDMKIDVSAGDIYRLKKGIMRYFAAPGKLELEIASFCENKNLHHELWPMKDTYDIKIQFPDDEVWAIDAKAYRNPVALRNKIQSENGFPSNAGVYERGYFVIPTEFARGQQNYTTIVNHAVAHQPNVKCITLRTLKIEINKKERSCHEDVR